MQNYLPARPIYNPKKSPYHIPRGMKHNEAQFRCMITRQYYKGKPSEAQLRKWCLEVPCSVNLNLLNICQIVKEERFQDRDTTDKKQMKIFARFLRKIAVPLYMRNKLKFDINLPAYTNMFRQDMFVQMYNFELLPSLTNCEHNSMDVEVLNLSSEVVDINESSGEIFDQSSELMNHDDDSQKSSSHLHVAQELESPVAGKDDQIPNSSSHYDTLCSSSEICPPLEKRRISKTLPDLINHGNHCQKSSNGLPKTQEVDSPLTETGDQLQISSLVNDTCCLSSELFPPLEVCISLPLLPYTQGWLDENMFTSTQN